MANLMRLWARWCARRVVHLWEAPEVVAAWLETGDEELRAAAAAAAYAFADDATAYIDYAVADSAAYAADDDVDAYIVAAVAIDAIYVDSSYDIKVREKSTKRQREAKSLIRTLSSSLTGLSSLRLDIAHSDPWLTREVWRTLELPDMQFVEDWYAWTQDQWGPIG